MVEEANKIPYEKHPFVQRLLDLKVSQWGKVGIHQSTPLLNYLNEVNTQCSNIKQLLRTLQISRVLVAERHPSVGLNSRIGTNEYLRYILENYFVRITTYRDQIFSLINTVLELEIKKGLQMGEKIKAKTSHLEDIQQTIERTNNLFTNIIKTRNQIAHEGQMDISDMNILKANDIAAEELPEYKDWLQKDSENVLNNMIFQNINEMMKVEEDMATDFFVTLNILLKYLNQAAANRNTTD